MLGVDGTLADAVKPDSPVRGKVRAKTGTLLWHNAMNRNTLLTSKALAGYLTTAEGRQLAIAFFVNNVPIAGPSEVPDVGRTLGRLCEIVHGRD